MARDKTAEVTERQRRRSSEIAEGVIRQDQKLVGESGNLVLRVPQSPREEQSLDSATEARSGQQHQLPLEERYHAACHEAGPAVVYSLLGGQVEFVEIFPVDEIHWGGWVKLVEGEQAAMASATIAGPILSFRLAEPDFMDDTDLFLDTMVNQAAIERPSRTDWEVFCDCFFGPDWESRDCTADDGDALWSVVESTRDLLIEPSTWAFIEAMVESLESRSDGHPHRIGRLEGAEIQELCCRHFPGGTHGACRGQSADVPGRKGTRRPGG